VKNMVETHIANDNTLILLTITMRDDINNQGAALLAKLADPSGSRTIGVLTKPDTLQRGEHATWLSVLEGVRHPLKLGYFVTKQPSLQELGEELSFLTARERERSFFSETSPWKELTNMHARFGTQNLTQELSKLLGTVISKALPVLREKCKEALIRVDSDLDNLPPPPSDQPVAELFRIVTAFSSDVAQLVRGSDNFEYLIQKCRGAHRVFEHKIRATRPQLLPFGNVEEMNTRERHANTKFQLDSEATTVDNGIDLIGTPMFLQDIRVHIERSLTRELPFTVPYKAIVSLIRRFCETWAASSYECLADVHEATVEKLDDLIDRHFGQYGTTGLLDKVRAVVEAQIEQSQTVTKGRIESMLNLEDSPFTLNNRSFASYKTKCLAMYKEARQTPKFPLSGHPVYDIIPAFKRAGVTVAPEDLWKLCGPDSYEDELNVMAETAAYFQIAYKRIIDDIPRVIDYGFLHSITKGIQDRLVEALKLSSQSATEKATLYLAEDEKVRLKRQSLQKKKEQLEAMVGMLWDFGG